MFLSFLEGSPFHPSVPLLGDFDCSGAGKMNWERAPSGDYDMLLPAPSNAGV
jgi:hypothetical protein